jgi:cytosine permease
MTEVTKAEHFRSAVPASDRVSGWRIGLIVFGVGTTLPVFFLGAQLGTTIGLANAIVASLGGCLFLGLLAIFTSTVGARTGFTSYLIIERAFGRMAARVINVLMAISLIGYFALTADFFARTMHDALASSFAIDLPVPFLAAASGSLMTLTAIFGFKAISRLSFLGVPLMCGCVGTALALAFRAKGLPTASLSELSPPLEIARSISVVASMAIQMAVLTPDVARFAINAKHGIISVWGLAFGFPIVLISAAVLAVTLHETSIMLIMAALGLAIPAFLALGVVTWTTNVVNVYSSSMTLATFISRAKEWQLTAGAGAVGTFAAFLGMADGFMGFLELLGILVPPIAGIYLADYYLVDRSRYENDSVDLPAVRWPAIVAWAVACAISYATTNGLLDGTGMPAADSLLVGFFLFLVLAFAGGRALKASPAAPASL